MALASFALFDFFSEDPPTVEVGRSAWIEASSRSPRPDDEVIVRWPTKNKAGKTQIDRCPARIIRFHDDRLKLVKLRDRQVRNESLTLTPSTDLGRGKRKRRQQEIEANDEGKENNQPMPTTKKRREEGTKKASSRLAETLMATPKVKKSNLGAHSFQSRLDHILQQNRRAKPVSPAPFDDDEDSDDSDSDPALTTNPVVRIENQKITPIVSDDSGDDIYDSVHDDIDDSVHDETRPVVRTGKKKFSLLSDTESETESGGDITLTRRLQNMERENRLLHLEIKDLHKTVQTLQGLPAMVLELTNLVKGMRPNCHCSSETGFTTPTRHTSQAATLNQVGVGPATHVARPLTDRDGLNESTAPTPARLPIQATVSLGQREHSTTVTSPSPRVLPIAQHSTEADADLVVLSGNVRISRKVMEKLNRSDPRKMAMDLMSGLFTRNEMASHTLTGAQCNAKQVEAKPAIDQEKVRAIQDYCQKKFSCPEKLIRDAIKAKLNGEQKLYRKLMDRL